MANPEYAPSYVSNLEKAQIIDKLQQAILGDEITDQQMHELVIDIVGEVTNHSWGDFDEIRLTTIDSIMCLGYFDTDTHGKKEAAWIHKQVPHSINDSWFLQFEKLGPYHNVLWTSLEKDEEMEVELPFVTKRAILNELLEAYTNTPA